MARLPLPVAQVFMATVATARTTNILFGPPFLRDIMLVPRAHRGILAALRASQTSRKTDVSSERARSRRFAPYSTDAAHSLALTRHWAVLAPLATLFIDIVGVRARPAEEAASRGAEAPT
jgi:hypothetical protein